MLKPTSEVVILVDSQDRVVGTEEKHKAHMTPPQRHRAFSVFAFNEAGEVLIQRRAFGKYHSAGLWANTCCGHPRPHEDIQGAAKRRTFEELGFTPGTLTPLTHVSYTLHLGQDLWELEYTHVFRCEYQSSFVSMPSGVDPVKAEIHSNGVIPAKAGIHGSVSKSVDPCLRRDDDKVLDTTIKQQDDAENDRDDTECDENYTSSRACLQTSVAIQENNSQTGLPRRAAALLAMTSSDTACGETSPQGLNINRDEVCDTLWISPAELLVDVKTNPQNYARWFRLYVLKYFHVIFGVEPTRMVAYG